MGKWEDPLTQIIASHIDEYQDLFLKHVPAAKPPLRVWKTSFQIGDPYWPQHRPMHHPQKRIDLILIDKSNQHLIIVEAKLPKPIKSHGNCSKNPCPICQINSYESMLQEELIEDQNQYTLHKVLLLFINTEAKRWLGKHQYHLEKDSIAFQAFPYVQTLIKSVLSCSTGHGHMLFDEDGDAYKERNGRRVWPIHHRSVFLPCEHNRYKPWPTSIPKQGAFDVLLRLKKSNQPITQDEYLSLCKSRAAGNSNLKADGRFAFDKAQLAKGRILLAWP